MPQEDSSSGNVENKSQVARPGYGGATGDSQLDLYSVENWQADQEHGQGNLRRIGGYRSHVHSTLGYRGDLLDVLKLAIVSRRMSQMFLLSELCSGDLCK